MKKIFLKIVIGVVLACILFVCFLYTNNEIGVTSSKLEADIRIRAFFGHKDSEI